MIVQTVVRTCLAAIVVVMLVGVHRPLLVREWKRLRKRWRTKRKVSPRPKKAKPFEGLTRQPICERCVMEAERQDKETKREPPAKIDHERGRRLEVDTSNHFCPEASCRYYGWLNKGNIISNGHPSGGQWRQLKCVACGKHFQETIGTVFYGSSVPAQDIMRAIVTLCEGVSPRKVARIYEVDKDTVFGWLIVGANGWHQPQRRMIRATILTILHQKRSADTTQRRWALSAACRVVPMHASSLFVARGEEHRITCVAVLVIPPCLCQPSRFLLAYK